MRLHLSILATWLRLSCQNTAIDVSHLVLCSGSCNCLDALAAGTNTFGSGSGSSTLFTVYSAATFGASGTSNVLTINSPTTQAGALTVSGASAISGAATFTGEAMTVVFMPGSGRPKVGHKACCGALCGEDFVALSCFQLVKQAAHKAFACCQ